MICKPYPATRRSCNFPFPSFKPLSLFLSFPSFPHVKKYEDSFVCLFYFCLSFHSFLPSSTYTHMHTHMSSQEDAMGKRLSPLQCSHIGQYYRFIVSPFSFVKVSLFEFWISFPYALLYSTPFIDRFEELKVKIDKPHSSTNKSSCEIIKRRLT